MFTGIHIMEPRIFDYVPRGVFSDSVIDVYPPAIAGGERIVAHVAGGMWYELSTLQRYLDISLALLRQQGRDVYSGQKTSIDQKAEVRDSILWDDVKVDSGARVIRSIIGDGVHVHSGEAFQDVVVVRAGVVAGQPAPAKALKGTTGGDNFVVRLSR